MRFYRTAMAVAIVAILIFATLKFGTSDKNEKTSQTLLPKGFAYRHCDNYSAGHYSVQCYTYRTQNNGEFQLPIALIKFKNNSALNNARPLLVQIPGGPGQGGMTTTEEIDYWIEWLEAGKLDIDVLLYDPRGTQEDAWDCQPFIDEQKVLLTEFVPIEEEQRRLHAAIAPCFDLFREYLASKNQKMGPRLEIFSTASQAKDIVDITHALGYSSVHLLGISYGTRVALAAAEAPHIKTLILDSPYPFENGKFSDWPLLYRQSFDHHSAIFQQLYENEKRTFYQIYNKVREHLEQEQVSIKVENWHDDSTIELAMNAHRLLELSYSTLYSSYLYRDFYSGLITFADTGEISEMLLYVLEHFVANAFSDGFNNMVYFATECVDNAPEDDAVALAAIDAFPEYRSYFEASLKYDLCENIDLEGINFIQEQSYISKPTLILSGEYDPVTPARWGQRLASVLEQAKHIQIANAGHGVIFGSECNWDFIKTFMKTQDVSVDVQCRDVNLWP